ncbi:hypothetical protein K3495_g5461 [Podosphaera aphanis]|nr:hypothetical protein K3495_g5461 [Podosphaera aphanis]
MFIISFFFIFSEVSWKLEPYFAKYWPLLSRKSGLIFLGLAMMTLGCRILGDLNKDTTTVEVLGLPAMRILISAGSLSLLFGFLNIIATYTFCHRKLGITARQIRSYGAAVKPNMDSFEDTSLSPDSANYATSLDHAGYYQASRKPSSSCFPLPIAARYGSRSSPPKKSDISPPTLQDLEKAENIAKHCSPVVPGLQRPPTAMHPAYQHNYPNTSRFSEVSAMSSRI